MDPISALRARCLVLIDRLSAIILISQWGSDTAWTPIRAENNESSYQAASLKLQHAMTVQVIVSYGISALLTVPGSPSFSVTRMVGLSGAPTATTAHECLALGHGILCVPKLRHCQEHDDLHGMWQQQELWSPDRAAACVLCLDALSLDGAKSEATTACNYTRAP